MRASPLLVMVALALPALPAMGCRDATGTNEDGPDEIGNGALELRATSVASGLAMPVHLAAPEGDDRLFVVEQAGRIRIIENGQLLTTPFLDIASGVSSVSEQGLLSIAFHPEYAANGFFYIDYTDLNGDTRIERYRVSADPNAADPGSGELILGVDQPFGGHNGGLLTFGPDGMLYIGMGDGGSAGDPLGHGQNAGTLLGALLRIDIDGGDPYAIPADNPFHGVAAVRDEIWAYGLRNPWRYSFDPPAQRLYIADVGQNEWEEVNAVDARTGGLNYGWNVAEGQHCFATADCSRTDLTLPVLEYGHDEGCSVIGGFVYRGSIPEIVGHYFYGDFCRGWVRSFRLDGDRAVELKEWPFDDIGEILSFGTDDAGELYILSFNGHVYRVEKR